MRILVVNPNTTAAMTRTIEQVARRYAADDTEVEGIQPDQGPPAIGGFYDAFVAAGRVLEQLARVDGAVDAVVLAGYGLPGRDGARQLLDVPVVDIVEASAHLACLIGWRFSVVTTLDAAVPFVEHSLRGVGLSERCASIRAAGVGVLDEDGDGKLARLVAASRQALDEDGAEVVCLGSGSLAGLGERLAGEIGAPVVDGVVAAVKLAEALHRAGLRTSKARAYAPQANDARRIVK